MLNNKKIIYVYNNKFYLNNYKFYEKMNIWPIDEIDNIKYFYTNELLFESKSNEKIISLKNEYYSITKIEENILNNILYESCILNVTNVHITNTYIIYKNKKVIKKDILSSNEFNEIYNYIKIQCNFRLLSAEDESGVIYINFLGNIIGVRISIFVGVKDFNKEDNILISMRFLKDINNNFYSNIIQENLSKIVKNLNNNGGITIIGGETGRGKTTFLYNLLDILVNEGLHIITIEDPVEKIINGVFQREVKNYIKDNKNNYDEILKSILRHNPDIIVIGEIRDEEFSKLCLRSILTGHNIITTMHLTNWINDQSMNTKEVILNNFLKRFENFNIKSTYIQHYIKNIIFLNDDFKVEIFNYEN